MATPTKVKKGKTYVRDERGRYKWRIAYKKNGLWTSGSVWAEKIEEAYAEIRKREQSQEDLSAALTWRGGHGLWEIAHQADGPTQLSQSYLAQVRKNIELFTEMHGDIAIATTTKGQLNQFFAMRAKVSGATANRARRLLSVANWLRRTHDVPFPLQSDDFNTYDETPARPRSEIPLDDIPRYMRLMWRVPRPIKGGVQYCGSPGKYEHAGIFILHYLFLTGVRSSEACELCESDVEGDIATFRQKGGKVRTLLCNDFIMRIIRYSMARKKRYGITHPYVFFNTRGDPWNENSLRHFWRRRLRIAAERGVELPYRLIHEIRHTFCTIAGSKNFGEGMIQAASGHASVEALRRYTHAMRSMQEEVTNAVGAELIPALTKRTRIHQVESKPNSGAH